MEGLKTNSHDRPDIKIVLFKHIEADWGTWRVDSSGAAEVAVMQIVLAEM